jgi:hypothetical protein
VIYRALPGGSDRIVLYYCLMATWTGLGDNTELFWAVLSHSVDFIRSITGQMSELVEILSDRHVSLLQCKKLLLL